MLSVLRLLLVRPSKQRGAPQLADLMTFNVTKGVADPEQLDYYTDVLSSYTLVYDDVSA